MQAQGLSSDGLGFNPDTGFSSYVPLTLESPDNPQFSPTGPFSAANVVFNSIDGWQNIGMQFNFATSSSTCNPYGIFFGPYSDGYPYSNFVQLYYNKQGRTWQTLVSTYVGSCAPGSLDAEFRSYFTTNPVFLGYPMRLFFVMNDNNVLVTGSLQMTWQELVPGSGVIAITPLDP
jgi:hypothetical protein